MAEPDQKIAELTEKLASVEEEMDFLKEDLEAADDEVEELEIKIREYETGKALIFSEEILKKYLKAGINRALHNIILTAPSIEDIDDLYLFEVNANINIKIACDINMGDKRHGEILHELNAFDNIDFRIFDGKDRWSLLVDGDYLLFGALGSEPDRILIFQTEDEAQVKLFNTLANEAWLRGKKVQE